MMMNQNNYLDLLKSNDSEMFEFPDDFDIDALELKVGNVKSKLEALMFDCEQSMNENASFMYSLRLNSHKLAGTSDCLNNNTYAIIFSNHGKFVMIYGEDRLPDQLKSKMIDILQSEDLVYIPEYVTDLEYDGALNDK